MTKESFLNKPKRVLLLGGWYLLTGMIGAYALLASLLVAFFLPDVGTPLLLGSLSAALILLRIWGAWRYLKLDYRGWAVLMALEGLGVLLLILSFIGTLFDIPFVSSADTAFGLMDIGLMVFILVKILILLSTKKYTETPPPEPTPTKKAKPKRKMSTLCKVGLLFMILFSVVFFIFSMWLASTFFFIGSQIMEGEQFPAENSSADVYEFEQPVELGSFRYTFQNVRKQAIIPKAEGVKEATGVFLVVGVKIENIGEEPKDWPDVDGVGFLDSHDNSYDLLPNASTYSDAAFDYEHTRQIKPGFSETGYLIFDIPKNINGLLTVVSPKLILEGEPWMKYVRLPED